VGRLGLLAAAAMLAAGCGTPDRGEGYVRAFAEAQRAESAGRLAEAAARYDAAADAAKITRDRDYARHLAALMLEHAGDRSAARERFEALGAASPRTDESASATYEAGWMSIQHGDEAAGWHELEGVVRRFPNDGVARPALHHLLAHTDETRGVAQSLALLRSLQDAVGNTERGEEIAYEIAVRQARVGETPAARDALIAVAERWPYPHGALFDNALFRASELDEQLGRYPEAIADLQKLLSVRESSWFTGSYERPLFDVGQMRIADLYADRMHDDARAEAELHKLYESFKTSLLRDRALWKEALLLERDGDHAKRCERLATLVQDFPDSRYVPCATALCPGVTRPKTSHAPLACHRYLGASGE
jgi:tetratricopeptide (TPR) repeat protein